MNLDNSQEPQFPEEKINRSYLSQFSIGSLIPTKQGGLNQFSNTFDDKNYDNFLQSFEQNCLDQQKLFSRKGSGQYKMILCSSRRLSKSQIQQKHTQHLRLSNEQHDNPNRQKQTFEEQSLINKSRKSRNIIQANTRKLSSRQQALMSNCQYAKPISKSLFTILRKYLLQLFRCRIFTQQEKKLLSVFNNSTGSIDETIKIFESEKIRIKSLEFISSPNFIKRCLTSPRMQFRTKIHVIKFLQRIRKLALPKEQRQVFFQKKKWREELTSIKTLNKKEPQL